MAVKMRLQRKGRKKRPFYHIVVADARAPRDGRFIEKLGVYNPMTSPATIDLDRDRAFDWLQKGAQPTDTVRAILRFKGVLYKKHLMRGVKKGALTMEEAEAKYKEWIDEKEQKIASRIEKNAAERRAKIEAIAGVPAPPPPIPSVAEEVAAEEAAEAAAEASKEKAAEVKEEAPAPVEAKEAVAEVKEEAPAPVEAKEAVAEVKEATPAPVEEAKEAVAEVKEEAKEAAPAPVEEAKETVAKVKEEAPAPVEEAKEVVAEVKEEVAVTTEEAVEVVQEKVVVKGDDPEWDNLPDEGDTPTDNA